MKYLKKVSLGKNKKIADDVKVALLNDKVKKQIFMNNIQYEASLAGKPHQATSSTLLQRLWSGIEHLPKAKRKEAISMIKKLESSPSVQISDNFELIYNGEIMRGTHILQLIQAELRTNQRVLVPGQDVFEHALLTSPASTCAPDPDLILTPPRKPTRRKRLSVTPLKGSRKRPPEKSPHASFLARTLPLKFIPNKLSPIQTRSARKRLKVKENAWKL